LNAVTYKCPACASPLEFSGEEQKLVCRACGNEYELEAVEALNETDESQNSDREGFDWGEMRRMRSEEKLENTVNYICSSCGAEIITDMETAATKCPYCDNVVVLSDKLSGNLRPNVIIPFKIDRDGVLTAVHKMCRGKPLLPKNFIDENKLKEIQGVYVPFWLYSCRADGVMTYNAVKVRSWSTEKYNYTETSYFVVKREGELAFERIPVDGSLRMDNALMDSIEPFDWNGLCGFDSKYLSGFVADRYDDDADANLPRASARVETSAEQFFRSTVSGYASVSKRSGRIQLSDTSVRYAMLPVYLIKTKYHGKEYTYAMNGQTGKIAGKLPVSWGKFWGWFAGITAGVTAALSALALLLF